MSAALDAIEACVCTLNEEANIVACLEAIRAAGIRAVRVIDGGSRDATVELARRAGATVLATGRGLASQRQAAIAACTRPYLFFIDADDRLDPDCPAVLLAQMQAEGYDALQAALRVFTPRSYCQRGMDALLQFCICRPGPSNMVGRPALYRTEALRAVGIDTRFDGVGNEDAALSIRMEQAGRRQGVGRGVSRRHHPAGLAENLAAWRKYGAGDARLVRNYPEKRRAILAHLLVNYPLKRAMALVRHGRPALAGYPVCAGLVRFWFMCRSLLRPEPSAGAPTSTPPHKGTPPSCPTN